MVLFPVNNEFKARQAGTSSYFSGTLKVSQNSYEIVLQNVNRFSDWRTINSPAPLYLLVSTLLVDVEPRKIISVTCRSDVSGIRDSRARLLSSRLPSSLSNRSAILSPDIHSRSACARSVIHQYLYSYEYDARLNPANLVPAPRQIFASSLPAAALFEKRPLVSWHQSES